MRKAFIQLHTAVFIAGFTAILGRLITLNEGLLVWYRLLFTIITMWPLFAFQKKLQRISFKEMMKIGGVGVIAALHWATFYASIKYSNVSVALVCFSSIGFFTAIFEPIITRSKFKIIEILLGLIAVVGISLIFHFDPSFKVGIILGIITAMLGSLFPILNRGLLKTHSTETVTVYELTGGFVFLTLVMPFYLNVFPTDNLIPGWQDLIWLLILAWVCTVLAFQMSMEALKKISAFTVNLTYNLEPIYGISLAFIMFREDKMLTNAFYVGLALIVCSVLFQSFLVYRSNRKPVYRK
ncbi:DMT family transporter [Pseudoflavitalea sp. G-6-1-2]|uniref:DMT family transporter n=1 Tax=Pseudoflavitalea sp. G-6-1-2 TaxID=2728841 RepID=UPI00146E6731|nr:DMT family transporter [Pseudoflavitalea sp. G-6-1-2]NML23327.1 DMT family transporter [Pseudoflavitalea sp. G-6-1-2]